MELFADWAPETKTACNSDKLSRSKVALEQMLVCYEVILTGESRALCGVRSDLSIDTLRHVVTADPLTFDQLTA